MKTLFYMPLFSVLLSVSGFTDVEYKQIVIRESFTRISVKGHIKVILVQSAGDSVLKYKDGNISAGVENGELVVRPKNAFFSNRQPFVLIPVKQLRVLKITDDAAVFTQGTMQISELYVEHKGTGMVNLDIDAGYVCVYSRGKGEIQIAGDYKQTLARRDEAGNMIIEYGIKKIQAF
ncbi:MAG: GIN domain-containing protein [Bacteroidota bacterium]